MQTLKDIMINIILLLVALVFIRLVILLNKDLQALKNEVEGLENEIKLLEDERELLYKDLHRLEQEKKELEDIKIFSMEATAYTDDVASQGKWVGQTATGMKPQVGVVAVDPKIIPLGTKLYVEGYGLAIAGDVGGAIKGHRIDLFMNTSRECYDFGRRRVKVRVIE